MSDCAGLCPLEDKQQDHRSVGIIDDHEIICRAAYDPTSFKNGIIKSAIVHNKRLIEGTLSVWRLSEKADTTLDSVVSICEVNTPPNNSLAELRGVRAADIRNVRRPEIEGRLFCIVDETNTDDMGGSHPAHAHIKICAEIMNAITDANDLTFQTAKEQLAFLFMQNGAKLHPS